MPESKCQRILIVDDDPDALALLHRHIERAGYDVRTASNGREAIDLLLSEGAEIVITDWAMPEMDGVELSRAIRQHEGISFTYVIFVTGCHVDEASLLEAFEAGADDYIPKPFSPKELLARLRAGERIVRLQAELDARSRQVHRYNARMEIVNARLAQVNSELNRLATTDDMTGLVNRREAMVLISDAWVSSQCSSVPLSVIALDVDRFKGCNDAYGHDVGDEVLRSVARVLQVTARARDTVCRMGGEEFTILCDGLSECEAAEFAERIRVAVEQTVIETLNATLRVTVSLGVAERTDEMEDADDLLRAADDALYAAKDGGRNLVCQAQRMPSSKDESEAAFLREETSISLGRQDSPTARVLVVDDDRSTRQLCRRFLENEGFVVDEAADGEEALERLRREVPDVVVMDAMMPKLDGLACTRRIKASPTTCDLPVIIASARTDATDVVAGFESGADEYLTKPFNPKELVLRVRTMVRLGCELRRSNEVRGEQSRALGIVSDFACDNALASSLEDVLDRTIASAAWLTGCRRAAILLPDAGGDSLVVARCLGFHKEAVGKLRIPIGVAVTGEVFASREPIVVSTEADARWHAADPDARLLAGVPSIAVPLCAADRVIGVLTLTGRLGGRGLVTTELDYLTLIANIASATIRERQTRLARDEARHSIVVALAKLAEHRDTETGRHLDRVSRFCVMLARELRTVGRFHALITDAFLEDLARAVPLHDIGKVAIPDRILLKPGPLTKDEVTVMQTHAAIGARTIRSVIERVPDVGFLAMAEEIAAAHHEWYSGEGYPNQLSGEEIPLAARIAAVADVYDAVTTKRIYKSAMSHEEAVQIVTGSRGRQFDPDVVDAFTRCAEAFRDLAVELGDDVAVVQREDVDHGPFEMVAARNVH